MANIEIMYRRYFCVFGHEAHCEACHHDEAQYVGCKDYCGEPRHKDKKGRWGIPLGTCLNSYEDVAFKGMKLKRYEIEEDFDYGGMRLKTRGANYDCIRIVLDGKVIYDEEAGDRDRKSVV